MSFIKKILDRFKADNEQSELSGNLNAVRNMSNKILLRELETHFASVLDSESLGSRMLYPMSFTVLMHPADFESRLPYLPHVVPEIVKSFYRIIRNRIKEYPNYEPPAKYWVFQFSPCEKGMLDVEGEGIVELERGKILTLATLTTLDVNNSNNTRVESNTRVSMKLENSDVGQNMNINFNSIKDINSFGESMFTINFDSSLNEDSESIMKNSNLATAGGLAELSYSRNGKNYHFIMKDNLINISGENDKRRDRSVFIIEGEESIRTSHIQIKYLPEFKKFSIAAFGPARLNSGKMNISSGGNVIWYDLANNSSIFINDVVSVRFEKKLS